jgi:glycogen operon protein
MTEVRPGDGTRLGAFWDGSGTNFAVYSSAAAYGGAVTLCLLGEDGGEARLPMWEQHDVWRCYLPGVGPGQRYGFRASGPMNRDAGILFDERIVLLDPYARAMTAPDPAQPRSLQSLVVDESFDWTGDVSPQRPWRDTILYETHVKGISAAHPDLPPAQRGTYAGLASPPILDHLESLGVTAVELLPIHQFLSETMLLGRGLTNYWGYSTIGFFAPHGAYAAAGSSGEQVREFKEMVKALHARGIEVILDVVYNHTAEGPPGDPAICFRGLANDIYYRRDPNRPGSYIDTTGTFNSLDAGRPEVLRLVMDSLRYWVQEMHVDGFRFDLAATLARQRGYVDRLSAFFDLLYQDPVLWRVKLIAEPWDVGAPDSYQVGGFPPGWTEWNDRYRDNVRDFWRGWAGIGRLADRLCGSSDIYGATRRGPDASINFVTAHDGKTLTDLVTYVAKHNEANGEGNRDGTGDDRADNFGVEGPSDDARIVAARAQRRRNLLATLLLSQGVSMLLGGDEIGRTQRGNNNAYCQDNVISWYDWELADEERALLAFTQRAIALQRAQPALRRRGFLTGDSDDGALPDVTWFAADGGPMTADRWNDPGNRFLGYLLAGDRTDLYDADGVTLTGDDVLVAINAGGSSVEFAVPGRPGRSYTPRLDTAAPDGAPARASVAVGQRLTVAAGSIVVACA